MTHKLQTNRKWRMIICRIIANYVYLINYLYKIVFVILVLICLTLSNFSSNFLSKWKAGKLPIQMVCVDSKGESLLSAGNSIKLWNLKTKELLMVRICCMKPFVLTEITHLKYSFSVFV